MTSRGIRASELLTRLQQLINHHGDKEVFVSGGDYPGGCRGAQYRSKDKGDGYIPGDTFVVF